MQSNATTSSSPRPAVFLKDSPLPHTTSSSAYPLDPCLKVCGDHGAATATSRSPQQCPLVLRCIKGPSPSTRPLRSRKLLRTLSCNAVPFFRCDTGSRDSELRTFWRTLLLVSLTAPKINAYMRSGPLVSLGFLSLPES